MHNILCAKQQRRQQKIPSTSPCLFSSSSFLFFFISFSSVDRNFVRTHNDTHIHTHRHSIHTLEIQRNASNTDTEHGTQDMLVVRWATEARTYYIHTAKTESLHSNSVLLNVCIVRPNATSLLLWFGCVNCEVKLQLSTTFVVRQTKRTAGVYRVVYPDPVSLCVPRIYIVRSHIKPVYSNGLVNDLFSHFDACVILGIRRYERIVERQRRRQQQQTLCIHIWSKFYWFLCYFVLLFRRTMFMPSYRRTQGRAHTRTSAPAFYYYWNTAIGFALV